MVEKSTLRFHFSRRLRLRLTLLWLIFASQRCCDKKVNMRSHCGQLICLLICKKPNKWIFLQHCFFQQTSSCGSANGGCQHVCSNGVCSCRPGYSLASDKRTCSAKNCGKAQPRFCAQGLRLIVIHLLTIIHDDWFKFLSWILYFSLTPALSVYSFATVFKRILMHNR